MAATKEPVLVPSEIWNGPRETSTLLTEAVYGLYRSDVAQVLGHPPFANSGFYAQLTDLPAGQVDLHVYVRDREKGEYVSPPLQEPQLIRRVSLAEGKVADAAWPVALAAAPDGRLFFGRIANRQNPCLAGRQSFDRTICYAGWTWYTTAKPVFSASHFILSFHMNPTSTPCT